MQRKADRVRTGWDLALVRKLGTGGQEGRKEIHLLWESRRGKKLVSAASKTTLCKSPFGPIESIVERMKDKETSEIVSGYFVTNRNKTSVLLKRDLMNPII